MLIKTYCKNIDLNQYGRIIFDANKIMIGFVCGIEQDEIYFLSRKTAMEFFMEIVEAMYNSRNELDLSHYIVTYNSLDIAQAEKEIYNRIINYSPNEDL